jgi:hypothetical protein
MPDDPIPLRPPSAEDQTAEDTLEPTKEEDPSARHAGITLLAEGFHIKVGNLLSPFEVMGIGDALRGIGEDMLVSSIATATQNQTGLEIARNLPTDHLAPHGRRRN